MRVVFLPRKLLFLLMSAGIVGVVFLMCSYRRSTGLRQVAHVRCKDQGNFRQELVYKWLHGYNESFHQKIPNISSLNSLSWPQLANVYHSYIENIQTVCQQMVHMGHLRDGGWETCNDPPHRPAKPCLIYSFGINHDLSFDDDVASFYGCHVHSFDPSTNMQSHRRSENATFHATGIANYDGHWTNWRMRRLKTIVEELGHNKDEIAMIKLDIEQWEWKTLPDMLTSGLLGGVAQLLVEFHITFKPQPKRQPYLDSLLILKSLYEAGFRTFYTKRNNHCSFRQIFDGRQMAGCHEVHMLRVK